MRIIGVLLLLFVSFQGIAQKSALTLDEAVMGRWSKFRPKGLTSPDWVPNSNTFYYFSDDYSSVYFRGAGEKEAKEVFSKTDLNEALGEEVFKHVGSADFIEMEKCILSANGSYYSYDITGKKINKLVSVAEGAANVDFNKETNLVAYTIDNNLYVAKKGNDQVDVAVSEDPNVVSGQAIHRFEFGISKGTFWSPSGKYLAFYQKDETNVADYPLLDVTKTPGELISIKYPMAGQPSEQAKVGVYDVASNKTYYLKVEGDQEQFLTNLGWGPEDKYIYLAVVNRGQNHMKLQKYEAATGNLVATLFEEKHEKWVEPEHPVWFIPGSNDEFLWYSERDGFMHLYRYNTSGELINQVTKGNWVVQDILGMDSKNRAVIIQTTDESGLGTVLRKVDIKTGKITDLTTNQATYSGKLSDDGAYLFTSFSDLNTPLMQRVIDTKSGREVQQVVMAEDPLANKTIGTTEIVSLEANDETTLFGRIIKPSDFDTTRRYPVLVYVYGGPHAQMVTNSYLAGAPLWMHEFAERGYIVFTLDNRGSKNRGFEFENVIHRQLGTVEMEDQLVGVNYLKSLPYVDARRLDVHGWSFGGFMTTSLMLREPGTFKVGVAGGPVTDWKYYEVMYGERYMDTPEENPEGYDKNRLHNYVSNLEGDLLLIHGTVDDVVVMQHNLSLVQAFVDAGVQVDFFPYPNHKHNVRGKDRVHLMEKVLDYIEEGLVDH